MSRFTYSFASPPRPEAIVLLEMATGIRFHHLDLRDWFCITAIRDDGLVAGVLVLEPRNWFDWHFSIAIDDPRCITRRILKIIFKTIFTRAKRLTAHIEPANKRALWQVTRLGFKYEGYIRCGVEGDRDALIYGMLPEDCRYLPGVKPSEGGTIVPSDIAGEPHGLVS